MLVPKPVWTALLESGYVVEEQALIGILDTCAVKRCLQPMPAGLTVYEMEYRTSLIRWKPGAWVSLVSTT